MNWTELALEILKQPEWLRNQDVKLWDETDGDGVIHDVIELVSPTNGSEDPREWTEDSGHYLSLCFNRNDDAWKACNVVVPSSMANQDSGKDIVNLVKLLTGDVPEIVDATSGSAVYGPYEEGDVTYRIDGKGYELSYDWDEIGGGFCRIVRHTVEPRPELDAKPYVSHMQIPLSVAFAANDEDKARDFANKLMDNGDKLLDLLKLVFKDSGTGAVHIDEVIEDDDECSYADLMLDDDDVKEILEG